MQHFKVLKSCQEAENSGISGDGCAPAPDQGGLSRGLDCWTPQKNSEKQWQKMDFWKINQKMFEVLSMWNWVIFDKCLFRDFVNLLSPSPWSKSWSPPCNSLFRKKNNQKRTFYSGLSIITNHIRNDVWQKCSVLYLTFLVS